MVRKVAILGDMGELGENEKELHREVGTFAGNCGIDLLICVGTLAKEIAEAAKESSIQAEKQLEAVSFDTLEELLMHLGEQVKQGDTILVKASHFMNFGKIVEALQKYNIVCNKKERVTGIKPVARSFSVFRESVFSYTHRYVFGPLWKVQMDGMVCSIPELHGFFEFSEIVFQRSIRCCS